MPLILASLVFAVSLSLLPSLEPDPQVDEEALAIAAKSDRAVGLGAPPASTGAQSRRNVPSASYSPGSPSRLSGPSSWPRAPSLTTNATARSPVPASRGSSTHTITISNAHAHLFARKRKRNLSTELAGRQLDWRPVQVPYSRTRGAQPLPLQTGPHESVGSALSLCLFSRRSSAESAGAFSAGEGHGDEDEAEADLPSTIPRLRRCSSLSDLDLALGPTPEREEYTYQWQSRTHDDLDV